MSLAIRFCQLCTQRVFRLFWKQGLLLTIPDEFKLGISWLASTSENNDNQRDHFWKLSWKLILIRRRILKRRPVTSCSPSLLRCAPLSFRTCSPAKCTPFSAEDGKTGLRGETGMIWSGTQPIILSYICTILSSECVKPGTGWTIHCLEAEQKSCMICVIIFFQFPKLC